MTHTEQRKPDAALNQNRGFTLVELMIALAILAIISAISIPLYNGYIDSARAGATRQNAEPLRIALEDYFLDNASYVEGSWIPGGDQSLQANLGWHPDGDKGLYHYTVVAGETGSIATSYTLTVADKDRPNLKSTCERNQTLGSFECTTTTH